MKLATFDLNGIPQLGVVQDQQVYIIQGEGMPGSMLPMIQGGKPLLESVKKRLELGGFESIPLTGVRLLAPISNPQKIMAIGHNYMDHIREQNAPVPANPMLFAKFPSSIIGTGETICWKSSVTKQVDIEAELGVVIGKRARNVPQDSALEYVFGYTVINDVSARDLQYSDKQWVRGKSLDTFCPTGPVIVTADEIPDPQFLRLGSRINDFVMQDSSTKEMIFSVAYLISYLTQAFTMEPGDLIATGTPNGVGMYRNPQIFLKDGDVITVEVEKIGKLVNPAKILDMQ
ncbi:MAG TPA: fumarylacetoacetate hydrolase family protein [Anaerolineaceae bacterium]|nr:fumarylacetoacetate hydrolase family protein [Anaerolineaceae bacterium]